MESKAAVAATTRASSRGLRTDDRAHDAPRRVLRPRALRRRPGAWPPRRERFARRGRELHGRPAAVLRRGLARLDDARSRTSTPRTSTTSTSCRNTNLMYTALLPDPGLVLGRGLAPAGSPTPARRPSTSGSRPPGSSPRRSSFEGRSPLTIDDRGRRRASLARGHRGRGRHHRRGEPRGAPHRGHRDRPGRRHPAARAHGHGAQPAHRRPRAPTGLPRRCTGSPTTPSTARCAALSTPRPRCWPGSPPCGTWASWSRPGLPARRRPDAGHRRRLDRRPSHRPGRSRHLTHRRPPRAHDVPAAWPRTSCRSASRRASPTASPRCARPCATRSSTAPG